MTSCPDSCDLRPLEVELASSGSARRFWFDAGSAFEGYNGETRVGEANDVDIAEVLAVGEACGEPNVACRRGDGSGSGLNVSGAGRFFCILLSFASVSVTSSDIRLAMSADVVDS